MPDARVAAWRARAALEHPAWLRAHRREVRLTLLACLCWTRVGEITDALIELFIGIVHKINARAERRVETELLDDLRRVRGKQGLLFAIADAAVTRPEDTVRAAIYPVVGEQTLRDLVRAKPRPTTERSRHACRRCCTPPTHATIAGCWLRAPVAEPRRPPARAPPAARHEAGMIVRYTTVEREGL